MCRDRKQGVRVLEESREETKGEVGRRETGDRGVDRTVVRRSVVGKGVRLRRDGVWTLDMILGYLYES